MLLRDLTLGLVVPSAFLEFGSGINFSWRKIGWRYWTLTGRAEVFFTECWKTIKRLLFWQGESINRSAVPSLSSFRVMMLVFLRCTLTEDSLWARRVRRSILVLPLHISVQGLSADVNPGIGLNSSQIVENPCVLPHGLLTIHALGGQCAGSTLWTAWLVGDGDTLFLV